MEAATATVAVARVAAVREGVVRAMGALAEAATAAAAAAAVATAVAVATAPAPASVDDGNDDKLCNGAPNE